MKRLVLDRTGSIYGHRKAEYRGADRCLSLNIYGLGSCGSPLCFSFLREVGQKIIS